MVSLVLLVLAFLALIAAAFSVTVPKVQLLPLGLALWALSLLLAGRL